MAEQTVAESFQKGYEAIGAVREDMASKDILSSMYAGQTPEEVKDPIKQTATLQSAAGMLQAKGLFSAAYKLQKQAGDLSTSVNKQQLDDLKVKQGMLEYSGQMLATATNDEDLNNAFSNIKDTSAQMNIQRVIGMQAPFEQKKKMLEDMTKSVDQHLKAQQISATAANTLSQIQNRVDDNVRADKKNAIEQAKLYTTANVPIPVEIAKAAGLPVPGGEAPSTFLAGRGAAEAPSYDTVAEGGALGKYGMKPKTLDLLRKIDPSLPKTNEEYLKDPKAQDKAASLLEKENEKEIKNSGNKVTQVNKDLFYRFGAPDATKILNAYDKNPNTKIDSIVGAQVIKENPDLAGKTVAQAIAGNVSVEKQPAPGLSLDKPSRGASKPSTDTPTSFVGSTGATYAPKDERETQLFANVAGPYKEPGVNNIKTNTNVTVAANEMKIGLDNMAILTNKGEKVPSRGAFSNLKTDTFFGAAASAATGPMSNVATQQFEALALPLIRQQATLILGTSASETDRKNLEKSLMTQAFAQSPVLAYQKLAEFAQSARAGIEGQASNPTLNKSQRESLVKSYQAINKAYPYTPQDVFTWQNQVKEGSKQTFGNYVAEKYPESGGSTTTPEGKPTAPMSSFLIKKD